MRKLKKTVVIVIAVAMLLQLAAITTVFAEPGDTGCYGDFDWEELDTGSVKITAYTGYGGSVTIPAMLSGKTVTDIDVAAFKYDAEKGIKYASRITEVIIQAPITSIAAELFSECPRLASVSFGPDVTEIGDKAFTGTALTSIKIPASVTTIGAEAFKSCSELASVTIDTGTSENPGMLTEIGSGAFYGTKITSVKIPSTVTTIGGDAFRDCASLASVTFVSKASITDIGSGAFYGTKLVSISIPSTIESIGDEAFANCDETLEKVIINSATVTLGEDAFKWSEVLTVYAPSDSTAREFCEAVTPDKIPFISLENTVGNTSITSAVSSGTNKITITWSEAERATDYEVWRKDSENGEFKLKDTVTGTSYTNTGLTVNTTYYYKVRGFFKIDETHNRYGSYSDTVSIAPLPGAPNSAYAASKGYSSIKVYWTPVPGASGYQIYRAYDKIDNTYSLVKTLARSTSIAAVDPNGYTFTGLSTGRKYFYKVRAYVNTTTTKCYGAFSGITYARPVPSTVDDFTAKQASPTSVKLSWDSVSGRTKYQIYRKGPDDEDFEYYSSTTNTSYTNDRKIVVDNAYSYKVRAVRDTSAYGRVYGGFSDIKTVTPHVLQVTGVSASRYTSTKIKITWSSLTGVDGYQLQYASSADAPDDEWTTKYTGSSRYYYHSVTHGKTYYYRVRAYEKISTTEKSYGKWSSVKSAKT